jgi:TRAP-type C4-dicarboxylate transport system permease small subunit
VVFFPELDAAIIVSHEYIFNLRFNRFDLIDAIATQLNALRKPNKLYPPKWEVFLYANLRNGFKLLLETIVILIMVSLTVIVLVAVIYRKAGDSLSWYDEVASVLLAWLTYYGAALAAINREHIGFAGVIQALKPAVRIPFIIISEIIILAFFALLAWVGFDVLLILKGDTLVSLPQISTRVTQSVIPIGAILFFIAEALGLPELLKKAARPDGFDNIDIPGENGAKPDNAVTEVPRS